MPRKIARRPPRPNRKRVADRAALLAKIDDRLRPLIEPEEITLTAATILGKHMGVNRCAYADVESDQNTFNVTGDYNRGVPSIVGRYTFAQFGPSCLQHMRAGKPFVVRDSETNPRTKSVLESYRATKIRTAICVPLMKHKRFVAAMAVHTTRPRDWRPDEWPWCFKWPVVAGNPSNARA